MDWLPLLIDCNGEWEHALERIYAQYCADFLERGLRFRGMDVRLRYGPRTAGKDSCFWHLISEGELEDHRTPDFRRCERIAWVRAVIERAESHNDLQEWQQTTRGKTNIAIALPDFSYIVFLGRRTPQNRPPYLILLTAYFIEQEYKRMKYCRQCEAFGP